MNIDQSTIVVTGGAGHIGSTTVELLLRQHTPSRIIILDDMSRGSTKNLESVLYDPRVTIVNDQEFQSGPLGLALSTRSSVAHRPDPPEGTATCTLVATRRAYPSASARVSVLSPSRSTVVA